MERVKRAERIEKIRKGLRDCGDSVILISSSGNHLDSIKNY
jgi:hypothetical protein